QMAEADWDAVHEVNLKGTFLCTQAVLSHMMKQHYGKIVNVSSIVALGALSETRANYASSKAGVIQLTKATAREAGPFGINVNAIAPGLIITPMLLQERTKAEVKRFIKEWAKQAALKRAGKAEDIASLALFLASDDSDYITGQVICCDGGHHDRM
ncbi:MAG: SDR family oxidoreductase, partial [Chloroflexi bacterium]|nr:SDR family oxidoreductase [Chloroflexota bacterium]